jgi:L-fucose isomerase-like protein
MVEKPRVGLIFVRAEWSDRPELQSLVDNLRSDAVGVAASLQPFFAVQGPWIVDTMEGLVACQHALREIDLDLVVLAYQTQADDARMVALLQAIGGRPLVVWGYQPWRRVPRPASFQDVLRGSGPVGTLAALGTLRNLGAPFLFTFGAPDDPRLLADLKVAGQAAQVRRELRAARIGLLPSRNEQMQVNFVDEFRLMTDFGPVVQYLSVSEYRRVVDSLSKVRVDDYLNQLRQRFGVQDVSNETLRSASQAALGLAHLAVDYRLDVLALNDTSTELQRVFGMRPGLYPQLLEPLQVLFQPEGDLAAATANFILHRLTGSPTLFMEIWFWDEPKNRLIGGHAGLQNPALALPDQVWISPDYEYRESNPTEGAMFQMMAKPGRVTLLQLRSGSKGWQAIVASGMCLEGQPWVQGFPHAVLRLDAPLDTFLRRLSEVGASQHWVMAYGSVVHEIEALCSMMNVPLEVITY